MATTAATLPTDGRLPRPLTFQDRLRAQAAIERVYYSHQMGADKPFEQAVPPELLERKVITYLKLSDALERFWNTPVTAEMLERELGRIARNTAMPERLLELYVALGNDAFVIKETLARATLVTRLSRSFFASDDRIPAGPAARGGRSGKGGAAGGGVIREPWSEWWERMKGTFRHQEVAAVARRDGPLPIPAPYGRDRSVRGGVSSRAASAGLNGAESCPLDDTWDNGSLEGTPDARELHTAIWTGTEMIVWGGSDGLNVFDTGRRYDPATDSWSAG